MVRARYRPPLHQLFALKHNLDGRQPVGRAVDFLINWSQVRILHDPPSKQ
ncbi:hypothetical protein [Providencia hangzhouensis]